MCGSPAGFALPSILAITLLLLGEPYPLYAVGMTKQDSGPTQYPGCGLMSLPTQEMSAFDLLMAT